MSIAGLMTAESLAKELEVLRFTVERWARLGKIPEVGCSPRCRRFVLEDVLPALRKPNARGEKVEHPTPRRFGRAR